MLRRPAANTPAGTLLDNVMMQQKAKNLQEHVDRIKKGNGRSGQQRSSMGKSAGGFSAKEQSSKSASSLAATPVNANYNNSQTISKKKPKRVGNNQFANEK